MIVRDVGLQPTEFVATSVHTYDVPAIRAVFGAFEDHLRTSLAGKSLSAADCAATPVRRSRPARAIAAAASLAVLAAILSGCAAAGAPSLIGTLSSGSPSSAQDSLTADELTWNCGRLENAVENKIARIVELQKAAKTEAQTGAPTLERMFERWTFGNTVDNNKALASIKTERAQAEVYNARLPAKDCAKIDIDAKLAAATPK